MKDIVELIKQLQAFNLKDKEIALELNKTEQEILQLRLKHNIDYKNKRNKMQKYLNIAKEIKPLMDKVYFPSQLCSLVKYNKSTILLVCNLYNLKPTKKPICLFCGKELEIKANVLPKYCDRKCRESHYRELNKLDKLDRKTKPIIKTCIVCNRKFEGSRNSKYCSSECKKLGKNINNLSIEYLAKKAIKELTYHG